MKKKILSAALAAAMCMSLLSGCGGQSTSATTAAAKTEAKTEAASKAETTEAAKQEIR